MNLVFQSNNTEHGHALKEETKDDIAESGVLSFLPSFSFLLKETQLLTVQEGCMRHSQIYFTFLQSQLKASHSTSNNCL